MDYRKSTKLSLDGEFNGINLYFKKEQSTADPVPPSPLVDLGFFIGIKHETEDLYVQCGDRLSDNRVFLYAGITKSGQANNAAKHGFVYLCEDSALSEIECDKGTGKGILIAIILNMTTKSLLN